MDINYENILYPEESFYTYKEELLDIYGEDYGEEYIDLIRERLDNTFYLFDYNPLDTFNMFYKHAKGDLTLSKRMSDEAEDYIRCRDKAMEICKKEYIELLGKVFNIRKEESELLNLNLSFLIDESIGKEEYIKLNDKYREDCKNLGVEPIYDTDIIKALIGAKDELNKYANMYILKNSLWGKRIDSEIREKFNISFKTVFNVINSPHIPNYGATIRFSDSKHNTIASILYLPIVYLLNIGIEDIDHFFLHEARHAIELGDDCIGVASTKYNLINEVRNEKNALKDLEKLEGIEIFNRVENRHVNSYEKLFPYVIEFFEDYRNILNSLALFNRIELFEDMFGKDDLLDFEDYIEKIHKNIIASKGDFYSDDEVNKGKKLIRTLNDNVDAFLRKNS